MAEQVIASAPALSSGAGGFGRQSVHVFDSPARPEVELGVGLLVEADAGPAGEGTGAHRERMCFGSAEEFVGSRGVDTDHEFASGADTDCGVACHEGGLTTPNMDRSSDGVSMLAMHARTCSTMFWRSLSGPLSRFTGIS
ncbi:MAG: hypothetical protein JF597_28975 [Streptomyces sp.]|uniref:hypothetical protein n=1 Tax=Streptomyces sp. TaxID=1931 RepID=UPI0025F9B5EA|nr:hypothetical protein [Streptomyces sp.]MBW8797474.1 hypothetical protein [Streptomyces sp.]